MYRSPIPLSKQAVQSDSCSFRTLDAESPLITCPSDVSTGTATTNAVVSYQTSAIDNSNETPTVQCEPANGSEFAIGKTNVTCIARDNSGNNDTCQFQVEVIGKCKP